ncbi:hypothetical protein BaRGS_00001635 [Batillaria attramentaria]|uniref:Uncharacterized protein n=1 Tax=Batillaria attramentaria TaxID=370345 RepID=A0ABD0M7K4_9CAEN
MRWCRSLGYTCVHTVCGSPPCTGTTSVRKPCLKCYQSVPNADFAKIPVSTTSLSLFVCMGWRWGVEEEGTGGGVERLFFGEGAEERGFSFDFNRISWYAHESRCHEAGNCLLFT